MEITTPGVYVLDRSWPATGSPVGGALIITADNVTLDLQGFELRSGEAMIVSTGRDVIIRNGTVDAELGSAIRVSGAGTRIEHVRAKVGRGGAIGLAGSGSTLSDSWVTSGESATGVSADDSTIVRNNTIVGRGTALRASSATTVIDNQIGCSLDTCLVVQGVNNTISRNRITLTVQVPLINGLHILGNYNHATDNVFFAPCNGFVHSGRAIVVEGQGNIIRDNVVPSCSGLAAWGGGVLFLRDGNFYGDNIVWATGPFNVGATVQTDLGGNVGFSN